MTSVIDMTGIRNCSLAPQDTCSLVKKLVGNDGLHYSPTRPQDAGPQCPRKWFNVLFKLHRRLMRESTKKRLRFTVAEGNKVVLKQYLGEKVASRYVGALPRLARTKTRRMRSGSLRQKSFVKRPEQELRSFKVTIWHRIDQHFSQCD
jgi:hypothetical protein